MFQFRMLTRTLPAQRQWTNALFYSTRPGNLTQLSKGEQHIYNKLQTALNPSELEVADVSGGCGSMYSIQVRSERFKGISKVAQQRLVNEILKEEIKEMHGLQLKTSA